MAPSRFGELSTGCFAQDVGNANFRDQIRRAESLEARGLRFLGMGFSAVDVAFGRLLAGVVSMFVYQEIVRCEQICWIFKDFDVADVVYGYYEASMFWSYDTCLLFTHICPSHLRSKWLKSSVMYSTDQTIPRMVSRSIHRIHDFPKYLRPIWIFLLTLFN